MLTRVILLKIIDNSPSHQDLQQGQGVLEGLRDQEDPKKSMKKLSQLIVFALLSQQDFCSGTKGGHIYFLTINLQQGH